MSLAGRVAVHGAVALPPDVSYPPSRGVGPPPGHYQVAVFI